MEPEKIRKTRPGRKRLFITTSVVLPFLLGIPVWWKLTEVYRAPLPFAAIAAHAKATSSALTLPRHFHVIFALGPLHDAQSTSKEHLQQVAQHIRQQMQHVIRRTQSNITEGCTSDFQLRVTVDASNVCLGVGDQSKDQVWPCGLLSAGLQEAMWGSDDGLLDEFFWSYSKNSTSGGGYTVVLLDGFPATRDNDIRVPLEAEEGQSTIGSKEQTQRHNPAEKRSQRIVVGKHRHAWLTGYNLIVSVLEEEEVASAIAEVAITYFTNGGPMDRGGADSMPLAADGEAILSFSLLIADPSDWIFDWAFEEVEQHYLQPLVEALAPVAHLSIESQVLYYTPKAVQSPWDTVLQAHVVPFKQLPFFVNANEWHLDSSSAAAGRSKLLHFAIYVPAAKECPLHLQLSSGRISQTNGFISPGWGGIIVWNPPGCRVHSTDGHSLVQRLSTQELEPLIGVVVAQLRTLFGLPPTYMEDSMTGIYGVPANATGFADWEVDVLLRRRAAMDLHASASTLASLSRLVRSLPNMVILDEIGDQVRSSLTAASAARDHALAGGYHATAEAARKARAWAEEAFFQPSIMSLLYFPAEHQLAIYTPFFVPVLLHTLVAFMKEGSRFRRELRSYQRKEVLKQD